MKYSFNPFTGTFDQTLSLESPLQFKGEINSSSDFPTSSEVETGWFYIVKSDVTDNDSSKTNTGQSFIEGDEIVWNGTNWTILGNENEYLKLDGSNANQNIDIGSYKLLTGGINTSDTTNYNFIYPSDDYHTYTFALITNPSSYSVAYKKESSISEMTNNPSSWGGTEVSNSEYQTLANPNETTTKDTGEDDPTSAGFLFKWKVVENSSLIKNIKPYVTARFTSGWKLSIWNSTTSSWTLVGETSSGSSQTFTGEYSNDYIDSNGYVYVVAYSEEEFDDTFYVEDTYLEVYADKEIKQGMHFGDFVVNGSLKINYPNTFGGISSRISSYLGKLSVSEDNVGFQEGYLATFNSEEGGMYVESGLRNTNGILVLQQPNTSYSGYTYTNGINIYQFLINAPNLTPYGLYITQQQGKAKGGIRVVSVGISSDNYASYSSHIQTGISYYCGNIPPTLTSNWGFYNDTDADNLMGYDNSKTYFGTGKDASIYYDGTNLVINPKEIGSGILSISGTIQPTGYNSSDGSAGATATTSGLTFKNGLYISGSINLSGYVPYTGATDNVDLGTYNLTANHGIFNGSETGQSIIDRGLVINEGGYSDSNADFRVESDTNSNALFLDASANQLKIGVETFVGDGGTTDYTKFETDGTMVAEGDARVWDDLQVNLGNIAGSGWFGSEYADHVEYRSGVAIEMENSTSSGYKIRFNAQLPHAYDEGEDIELHIHIGNNSNTSGNAVFKLTYQWANMEGTYGTSNTTTKTITIDGTDGKHQYEEIIYPISGSGKKISSILLCQLERVADDSNDTFSESVYIIGLDFHYPINMLGSHERLAK